jgi:hypothetical protein
MARGRASPHDERHGEAAEPVREKDDGGVYFAVLRQTKPSEK